MIKEYIDIIVETKDKAKMEELGEVMEDVMYSLKETHYEEYEKYREELYEMAYGKVINKDMAYAWVSSMKPVGEYWTMEQTNSALQSLGYSVNNVDFYVVANMMYNDYNNVVKENEELALKLAYDWLKDEDAKEDKLYCYWKNIAKK